MIVTSPATAVVEAKLTALLDELIGAATCPALTGALYPDDFPILVITARRDGLTSSSILDLDVAATLTDRLLDEEIRWMIGRAIDELIGDIGFGDS